MSMVLQAQAKKYSRPFPEVRPGYTVRVHQKVVEGEKERIQVFEGLVISVHKGRCVADGSFTVRKIVENVGVEKVFPICSPNVTKVEVIKVAKVRRAKLFFLRGRRGKSARLSERFTTADEFKVAVAEDPVEEVEEEKEAEGTEETKDKK
jgi:large subunit ribosomal protein L19